MGDTSIDLLVFVFFEEEQFLVSLANASSRLLLDKDNNLEPCLCSQNFNLQQHCLPRSFFLAGDRSKLPAGAVKEGRLEDGH